MKLNKQNIEDVITLFCDICDILNQEDPPYTLMKESIEENIKFLKFYGINIKVEGYN